MRRITAFMSAGALVVALGGTARADGLEVTAAAFFAGCPAITVAVETEVSGAATIAGACTVTVNPGIEFELEDGGIVSTGGLFMIDGRPGSEVQVEDTSILADEIDILARAGATAEVDGSRLYSRTGPTRVRGLASATVSVEESALVAIDNAVVVSSSQAVATPGTTTVEDSTLAAFDVMGPDVAILGGVTKATGNLLGAGQSGAPADPGVDIRIRGTVSCTSADNTPNTPCS